jgi:excisionase family DNA binding protein
MNKFLTQDEAAERLGVSASTMKRWRFQGLIPYIPGRPVLFGEQDLADFTAGLAEEKRKKAAICEPGTPEFLAKSKREARQRATVAQLHRRFKAKWGREK